MIDRARLIDLARAALLPAACLGVTAYFGLHAISGNTGLIAWQGYKSERTVVERQALQLATDKAALARQVDLLDPRHVDRDLADELVRRDLGVVRADEVIIALPDTK